MTLQQIPQGSKFLLNKNETTTYTKLQGTERYNIPIVNDHSLQLQEIPSNTEIIPIWINPYLTS